MRYFAVKYKNENENMRIQTSFIGAESRAEAEQYFKHTILVEELLEKEYQALFEKNMINNKEYKDEK